MTIVYNPHELKIAFIFKWRGTIFPLVLSDPMFWFLMIVHVMLLIVHGALLADGGPGLPPLEWNASTVAMGLLTFFLVFFSNHCYQRYFELHGNCTAIGRTMWQWAHLIRTNFAKKSAAQKWNLMRPFLGAMHIHYAFLRCEEDDDGQEQQGVSTEEWRAMRRTNLFTRAEVEQLHAYRGNMSFLAASWALGEVKSAVLRDRPDPSQEALPDHAVTVAQSAKDADANHSFDGSLITVPQLIVFNQFEATVRDFCKEVNATMEILAQPVPFPYFHILKLQLLVALLVLSYALVEITDANAFLSLTCYSITLLVMIGLQQVAIAMSDPFGSDDVDFELEAFIGAAYDNAVALLMDNRIPYGEALSGELGNPLTREGDSLRRWATVGSLADAGESPRGGRAQLRYDRGGYRKGGGSNRSLSPAGSSPPSSPTRLKKGRMPSARKLPPPSPSDEQKGQKCKLMLPPRVRPALPSRGLEGNPAGAYTPISEYTA